MPRSEVRRLFGGLTPAKLVGVLSALNIVEIMMAMQKMRCRQTPANQAHVTSAKDHPVLLAADAAEAALRGFVEIETTVGVVRYAPFNALALLVGGQVGRPGTLSQDALEEAFELQIGMRGPHGLRGDRVGCTVRKASFVDGDDTPWSKSFLASAYASRGLKMRFTSGTGSEVQMVGRRGALHALPGGPVHPGHPGRGGPGAAERLHLLHRRARGGALGDPGGGGGRTSSPWPWTWRWPPGTTRPSPTRTCAGWPAPSRSSSPART